MKMGNALIFELEDFVCLAASRNLKLDFAVEGRYRHLSAKGSLSKVDWQLIEDVVTISGEELVW